MADAKISELPSATPQAGDQFPFVRAGVTSRGSIGTISGNFTVAGNVGIGETSPARQLSISDATQSNIQLTTPGAGSTVTDGFQLQFDGNSNYIWGYENTPTLFGTNGTERMRITSAGNVGIGTANPSRQFIVYDTDANVPTIGLRTDGSGTTISDGFDLQFSSNNTFLFNRENGYIAFGTNNTERMRITSAGVVHPGADNTQTLGSASFRWSEVFAGNGTINTSDAREKTAVRSLTAAEIAAAKDLAKEIGAFQFLAAVEKKGDDARTHIGMTVQRAIEIMEAHDLDPMAYGFICHDEWDAETTEHPATDDAEAWTETTLEAGDRYGFRVDQLLLFMARGFEARLAALEASE